MGFWDDITGAISTETQDVGAGLYAIVNHPIDTVATVSGISSTANPLSPGATSIESDLPDTAQKVVNNVAGGVVSASQGAGTILGLTPWLLLGVAVIAIYFVYKNPRLVAAAV